MSKELSVEALRERPDELIDAIEKGEPVTLTREGRTIGTYSPSPAQRGVKYPFRDIYISPLEKPLDIDPAQIIIDERDRERSEEKWRS